MAAPSSAQTNPSQTTRSAPRIHASRACGPPIAATMIGIVMNGPTPIMSFILTVTAPARPTPRIKPCEPSADGRSALSGI